MLIHDGESVQEDDMQLCAPPSALPFFLTLLDSLFCGASGYWTGFFLGFAGTGVFCSSELRQLGWRFFRWSE
jgi:hypothetical protein